MLNHKNEDFDLGGRVVEFTGTLRATGPIATNC